MTIFQFLRIFLARWLVILVCTVSAAIGAAVVAQLVRPRYEAVAKVMLSFAKPDPVTGQVYSGVTATGYLDAQRQLILSERVAGHVVDAFGWLGDPGYMAQYQSRSQSDNRDFKRWLSQKVIDDSLVWVDGTIMSINYKSSSAEAAKLGAEELRKAYVVEALAERQNYARRFADLFASRAEASRKAAEQAEMAKAAYERETGIVLTDANADLESSRLAALASQLVSPAASVAAASGPSASSAELIAIDAEIARESERIGPNHPRMIALNQRRQQVATLVSQENRARVDAARGVAGAGNLVAEMQAQRSKVIGQRDKVERLRQLQADVDLRRDEYKRTAARSAELALEASMAESGATLVGPVLLPTSPIFPKKGLMVGGATVLGFGLGIALALLLELLNRRVRGVEDLEVDGEIHCIGVVSEPAPLESPARRLPRTLGRFVTLKAAT